MAFSSGNRKVLESAGSISHSRALAKAKSEYDKYQESNLSPVEQAYLETIKDIDKKLNNR